MQTLSNFSSPGGKAHKRRQPQSNGCTPETIKEGTHNSDISPSQLLLVQASSKSPIYNGLNSYDSPNSPTVKLLSKTDKDIVRLIGQHLQNMGFSRTVDQLILESGCMFEHPLVAKFRQFVIDGNWTQAEDLLAEFETLMISPIGIMNMKFSLKEQKYLEFLEMGNFMAALECLRNELTPLQFKTERVHELTFYIVCQTADEVYSLSGWEGKSRQSRIKIVEALKDYLPSSVMLPSQRLMTLLSQAIEHQMTNCVYHNSLEFARGIHNISLLHDHECSKSMFPCRKTQILKDHVDEIWFCRFSPNGTMLATGAKDGAIVVYQVNMETHSLTKKVVFNETHAFGSAFVSWCPNSRYLLSCGTDDCADINLWDVQSEKFLMRQTINHEDSLTTASWHADGERFVAGGTRGQFYLFDLTGTLLRSIEGVRSQCLVCLNDNKTVLSADTHFRIRAYNFDDRPVHILKEDHPIMSFTLDKNFRLALLNVASQGLHMWDIVDKCLLRRFQGVTQGVFNINSCFGGINEDFIVSGSEDSKIYLFHNRKDKSIAILEGHVGIVSCVHWNPVIYSMIASVGDDMQVRIWGPSESNQSKKDGFVTSST